jgi:hypothetical protein
MTLKVVEVALLGTVIVPDTVPPLPPAAPVSPPPPPAPFMVKLTVCDVALAGTVRV